MKKAKMLIGTACAVALSLPALAQQNIYQFDVGSELPIAIPAMSDGLSENVVGDDESPQEAKLEMLGGVYVKTLGGNLSPLSSCSEYLGEGMGAGLNGNYRLQSGALCIAI